MFTVKEMGALLRLKSSLMLICRVYNIFLVFINTNVQHLSF